MKIHLHHLGAIDRAIARLRAELDALAAQPGNYDAMFPEADIKALEEVKAALDISVNSVRLERP